jgi:NADH dehydrogenase [ubiquinone] 1 alpha subcomplex assembly factor 7
LNSKTSSPLLTKSLLFSSSSPPESQSPTTTFVDDKVTDQYPTSTSISIDRSDLYNPPGPTSLLIHSFFFAVFLRICFLWFVWLLLYSIVDHSHEPTSESELVKHLKGIIKVTPIYFYCLLQCRYYVC